MAIRELDKIPTKALMARITAELEGLIVTDADGRYIYVNHRWSSLTGYTLDQVKGRYVRDIVRNSRVDEVLKSQKFVSGDAVLLNICTNEEVPVYCSYKVIIFIFFSRYSAHFLFLLDSILWLTPITGAVFFAWYYRSTQTVRINTAISSEISFKYFFGFLLNLRHIFFEAD